MSRPRKDKSEKPYKAPPGSKGRVLADIGRYMENPDALMVSHGLAGRLANTSGMNISPSKMYEDGGHKLAVVSYLAERGRLARMPRTRDDLITSLGEFFAFCGDNCVPPTIGGFAVWNGVSVQRVNQVERDKTNAEMSEAVTVCKDAIRNFLEMSAMDSTLNPIVYFHQNKVYYGAVEVNAQVIRVEDNSAEMSDSEYNERVILLSQGSDGVYREE